jgi:hypothetical protein
MGASLAPLKTANWPTAKAMLLMGQDIGRLVKNRFP